MAPAIVTHAFGPRTGHEVLSVQNTPGLLFEFRVSRGGVRVEMTVMAPDHYWLTGDGQETVRLFGS